MATTTIRKLGRLFRRLSVRVTLVASLALVAILGAKLLGGRIPLGLADVIGTEALNRLLDILATSMLAVTTFSLSVWVTVRQTTVQILTPRAHRTLLQDTKTQTVIATFVGAWIYSVASIVLLSTPFLGEDDVVMLYLTTLLVLVLIVVSLLRWILHLQTVGSLMDTARQMEEEAAGALRNRLDLATHPLDGEVPAGTFSVAAPLTGYVQDVDGESLQRLAEKAGVRLYILAEPGRFVHAGEPIARVTSPDGRIAQDVLGGIQLGRQRTTEQDARFGVIQLSEIASKALSPGINDPGTAVDVVGRIARALEAWTDPEPGAPRCDRLWSPRLDPEALVRDAFDAIARDGSKFLEVQVAIQDRLASLVRNGPEALREPARAAGRRAYARAQDGLDFEDDRARLDRYAPDWVRG